MADNTTLNTGAGGDVIATDDISGVKHQRVKLEWGPDGTANEVDDADGKRLPIKTKLSSTGTATQVSDTSTSTTLLASNSSRLGATIFNDSSALLYVLLGSGTASSTNYTAKLFSNGFLELPYGYTGIIVGVWASDPNDGGAKVTEFT